MIRYLVFPELAGQRLDTVVAALSGLSRRRVRSDALAGGVWINGKPARVLSRALATGDVVDVIAGDRTLLSPPTPPSRLTVLHEDGWLVAVDKPAGIASQGPRQRRAGELTVPELLTLQLAFETGQRREPILVHRLDRLTTGVMIFALQREASRSLAAAWSGSGVDKRYLAIVSGQPARPRITVEEPIGRDALSPGRFRVDRRGKPARSEIRLVSTARDLSLVEVRPLTGRTHQVRVHLAQAGLPVAGDSLYGGGTATPRPFLHAWRLSLPHPGRHVPLRLEAPVPTDMMSFLEATGLALDPDPLDRGRAGLNTPAR